MRGSPMHWGRASPDIQYFCTPRLLGEPASGVDGVHSHPVEPRQVRVTLDWKF